MPGRGGVSSVPRRTPELIERYSAELQVNKDTPPACPPDHVRGRHGAGGELPWILRGNATRRGAGRVARLRKGPHGFGLRPGFGPVSEWPKAAESWLRLHGWGGAVAAALFPSQPDPFKL